MENIRNILKCISYHLSYYKGEYTVTIQNGIITMSPVVEVFPNIHHRKDVDKEFLIVHIFKYHYPQCIEDISTISVMLKNIQNIEPNMTYTYTYSMNRKFRKWIRVM